MADPSLKDRLNMSVTAVAVVGGQVLEGCLGMAIGAFIVGVKVLALPISMVDAFLHPHEWKPPC